jgi:hypothetical protein
MEFLSQIPGADGAFSQRRQECAGCYSGLVDRDPQVKPPKFELIKEGDVPVFDSSAGRIVADRGGYLPEEESLSILDTRRRPEKRDYLKPLAAVIALALSLVAVRVIWYYSTNHVDFGTSPIEHLPGNDRPARPAANANGLPEDTTLYYADPGVELPVLVSKVEPRGDTEDKVLLMAVIDTTGRPTNPKIWHGVGADLNIRAIEAVGKWRYRPGMKDGKPVPVFAQLEVTFQRP